MRISVIIPTYNEEHTIGALLGNLRDIGADEVIVADGGSTDTTVEIAERGAHVVRSAPGRGVQMNTGAAEATGDVLWFLHADVRLSRGSVDAIRNCMADPAVVGGNLDILYGEGDRVEPAITFLNRWRTRLGWIYGDSGIFCRRTVFESLGGYESWALMEDYEFARRMMRAGKVVYLREPIRVSARRWRKGGAIATYWSWMLIQGLYWAGVSPNRLAKLYRVIR